MRRSRVKNIVDIEKIDEDKGKYEKISKIADGVADISGGIPVIGGIASSVASGISYLSQNAANALKRENPNKDNWYFVLPTSGFYEKVEKIVKKIIDNNEIQRLYKFNESDYEIQMWDDFLYRFESKESTEEKDISYFISIEFKDDTYSFKEVTDENCSVTIQFSEKFKQINFETNVVFSAFEIISHGHTPSNKRAYDKLSEEIVIRLCNNLY